MAAGPAIGERLGKYLIEAELGRGGMGVVYRARHVSLDRIVAIKLVSAGLSAEAEGLKRFRLEAQAIARLNHPNIVQVFDIEESDDLTYLVMEYVSGESLDALLKRTSISIKRIARIAADIAGALHFAHGKGVLHRDIKPANVLLSDDRQVKVADFGLAYLLDTDKGYTKTGILVGSPHYMSPEQCQGLKLDRRSDLYSLGVVLFKMLTGRLPFQSDSSLGVLMKQIYDAPPDVKELVPDLPEELAVIVRRALMKKPDDRFADMREMRAALLVYLGEKPDDVKPGDSIATMTHADAGRTEIVEGPTALGVHEAASPAPRPSRSTTARTAAVQIPQPHPQHVQHPHPPRPPQPPPAPRSSALPWLIAVLLAAVVGVLGSRFLPQAGGSTASAPTPAPRTGTLPGEAAPTAAAVPASPSETSPATAMPEPAATPVPEPTATEPAVVAPTLPAPLPTAVPAPTVAAPPGPSPTAAPPLVPTARARDENIEVRVGEIPPTPRAGRFCFNEGKQSYVFPKGTERPDAGRIQIHYEVTPPEPAIGDRVVVRALVTNESDADFFVERFEESDPTGTSAPAGLALVKNVEAGRSLELRKFTVEIKASSNIKRTLKIDDGKQGVWTRSFELAPCR